MNKNEQEITILSKHIPRGYSILELGGGMGEVSCFLNKELSPPQHIVIEANPNLIRHIEKIKREKQCDFMVINKIISYNQGPIFNIDKSFASSSEKRSGSPTITEKIHVVPIQLKDLVNEKTVLIADIEGNEIDMITNEIDIIKKNAVCAIIEFHPRITGRLSIFLAVLRLKLNGFKVISKIGSVYFFMNKKYGY